MNSFVEESLTKAKVKNQIPVLGVIPARYASTRFPGKPLADIKGKSMIQRVYEQSIKSKSLSGLIVATDDERIYKHVIDFGGHAVYTKSEHPSGTDRCQEVMQLMNNSFDYLINIQGDEPFIDPGQIDLLGNLLNGETELATLMIPVHSHDTLFDTGEVKIVLNTKNEALYFSREVIPHIKGIDKEEWHKHFAYFRHVGMYAYRKDVLHKIAGLPVSALEKAESLEQLRWLENGFKIKCAITDHDSHCIDNPEDIEKVLQMMNIK